MVNHTKLLSFTIFLIALAFQSSIWADQTVISLEVLNKSPGLILTGTKPIQTIYLAKPLNWTLKGLSVRLRVQASPVLLGNSSLTADINGVPLSSRKLSSVDTTNTPWEIRIPSSLLGQKLIALNIRGYLRVDDRRCQDITDPAIWVNIAGQSEITYDYDKTPMPISWKKFPAPFIDKNNLWPDTLSLYVSEQANIAELRPYLNLVHFFAQNSSWRGLKFSLKKQRDLANIASGQHALIIGTAKELAPYQAVLGLPFTVENGQWRIEQKTLKTNQGFAWLGHPNQQTNSTILVIGADTHEGIEQVITMLSQAKHMQRPSGALWLSRNMQDRTKLKAMVGKHRIRMRFSELGLGDQLAYGQGQSIQFDVQIPFFAVFQEAKLHLDYSYTPFIAEKEPSYLEVSINNQPAGGIILQPNVQTMSQRSLDITPALLLPGTNQIGLRFDLAVLSRACESSTQSQAWGIIYKSSSITLMQDAKGSRTQDHANIRFFPYMLSPNLLIKLPDISNIWDHEKLIAELITLVSKLTQSNVLRFSHDASPNVPETFNLLAINFGVTRTNPARQQLQNQIQGLARALQASSNFVFQNIDYAMLGRSFVKDESLGLIGVDAKDGRYNMAVYGLSSDDLLLALRLINNDYRRNLLSGNLAIAFSNDTFTNLNTTQIIQEIADEQQKSDIGMFALKFLVFSMLAGSLLLAVYLFWRSLRNKSV